MNVETKTTACLIDELITASQKCWHAQDRLMDRNLSDADRLKAAEAAQVANANRCALVRALEVRFGEAGLPNSDKTYIR